MTRFWLAVKLCVPGTNFPIAGAIRRAMKDLLFMSLMRSCLTENVDSDSTNEVLTQKLVLQ